MNTDQSTLTQGFPHSVQAEKAVLSVIMQYPEKLTEHADISEDFFYLPRNRDLFKCFAEMIADNKPIEAIAINQELLDTGRSNSTGGIGYLAEIMTYQPTDRHFTHHIDILREKYACRLAIKAASQMNEVALSSPSQSELMEVTGKPIQAVLDALTASKQQLNARQLGAEWWESYQNLLNGTKQPAGWLTGIVEFDEAFRGLQAGHMGIISARSSGGKSTLATQLMCGLSQSGISSIYLPLEGTIKAAYTRCMIQLSKLQAIAITSPIEYAELNSRTTITNSEKDYVVKALKRLTSGCFHFDAPSNRNVNTIISCIRKAHRLHGIKVAFVDYVQLLKGEKGMTKEQEMMGISNALQELAANLGISLVVMSQENSEGETKHARAIEEDSDWTISIVQDQDKNSETYKEHQHILVTKDRHNGKSGYKMPLVLDRSFVRFVKKEFDPTKQKTTKKQPIKYF
jgi:replicative DNA helicase